MQTFKSLFLIAIAVTITSFAHAQQYNSKRDGPFTVSKTFKVNGTCEMCKHRIEGSINSLPGIWYSYWDVSSKTLLLTYDRTKITPAIIEKLVSAEGYDINSIMATSDTYNRLPECCHYQRKS